MKEVAVVDIETTGFQDQGGMIVEIGIVGLDLDTGKIDEKLDVIVKESGLCERHTRHPYGWIFKNSSLTFEEVMAADDLQSTLPLVQQILDEYPLGATAFNKKFDFNYLKSRGLKIKELPCIMLSATPVVNLPPNPGFSSPKWPSVNEAWKFFFPNVSYNEAHRGLDDAKHEALILFELYKLNKFDV